MRIAITGSHGTGKTTLCRQSLEKLNGITIATKEELMRIAVTGAHGTGKTTLSKLTSGRLKYHYLPEAPFQAFQAGFTMNEQTSLQSEMWIFAKQFEMEQRHPDNWVADKCLIDLLAYAHYLFPKDNGLLNVLSRASLPNFKRYDLVIYLPTGEFPIEDDGYRSTDPMFQEAIDRHIRGLLSLYEIPHHTITGTPEVRFAKLERILEQAKAA